MSNQQVGHGATILFGTSNWQANVNVESIKIGPASRVEVDTSHLGLAAPSANTEGNATSTPGKLHRLGPVTLEVQFDPGAGKLPPLTSVAETITITFPNAETWSGSGYVTERGEINLASDELVTCQITIARTGAWTVA